MQVYEGPEIPNWNDPMVSLTSYHHKLACTLKDIKALLALDAS